MSPQLKNSLLKLCGGVATLVGIVAAWLTIEVFMASRRPGAETFGFEFIFIPCFLAAAAWGFGVAYICLFEPNGPPSQLRLWIMLIVTMLIAFAFGLAMWLGS